MAVKKRRRRAVGRNGFGQAALSALIVCISVAAMMIAAAAIFLKVDDIKVSGNMVYTADEIIEASGIDRGESVVTALLKGKKVTSGLDYVKSTDVRIELPTTVVISVAENRAVARIMINGRYYHLAADCTVLNDSDDSGSLIDIYGLKSASPVKEGNILSVSDEEQTNLSHLTMVLSAIADRGIESGIKKIDVSNISNISFDYIDRFTVSFGSGENAEYKIDKMLKTIQQLESTDTGVLDVSKDGETRLIPYSSGR